MLPMKVTDLVRFELIVVLEEELNRLWRGASQDDANCIVPHESSLGNTRETRDPQHANAIESKCKCGMHLRERNVNCRRLHCNCSWTREASHWSSAPRFSLLSSRVSASTCSRWRRCSISSGSRDASPAWTRKMENARGAEPSSPPASPTAPPR